MTIISISTILNNILLFIDAESLIRYGGLFIVCLVVYGSTGLFFCFFLPTGAVLFTAGVFAATGGLEQDVLLVCGMLILSSVLGSITGYGFGWQAGQLLYRRSDSRFFKRQHLIAAEVFFKKHGWLALTAGFFLPIIRTFAPIVAGMIRLNFRRFVLLIFSGSVIWIFSFVYAGWFIGSRPFLQPWLKYIVIGFILTVTVPLLVRIIKEIKKSGVRK
jgi:membrane-associated protein